MNRYAASIVLLSFMTISCVDESAEEIDTNQQSAGLLSADSYKFVTVDFPGFTTFNGPIGINKEGDLAGFYDDQDGVIHGYVRRNGTFTALNYPGSSSTWGTGITDRGDVNGTYFDSRGFQHGFLLRNSQFSAVDVPGAAQTVLIQFEFGSGLGTAAFGFNDLDGMVGEYADRLARGHGWLRVFGQFLPIDFPTADPTPGGGTSAISVNDSFDVVGKYWSMLPPFVHGYKWSRGRFTPIEAPKAGGLFGTQSNGINDLGEIVGVYGDANNKLHGFLLSQGRYTTIDFPGAPDSECHSINARGDITGTYFDASGLGHGFVALRRR